MHWLKESFTVKFTDQRHKGLKVHEWEFYRLILHHYLAKPLFHYEKIKFQSILLENFLNQQYLMILILVALAVALLVLLSVYFFYFHPRKLIRFYKGQFEKLGLKVYDYPILPLRYAEIEVGMKAQLRSRDVMSVIKEVASEFDVSITNLAQRVQLNLVSPKLMQAFFECDQERFYRKDELFVGGHRRAFGNGITLTDGAVWKHKRRVVTKMLNFGYISQLVPRIEGIIERKTGQLLESINTAGDQEYHEFDLLELTTTIASTIMIELFFGGCKFDVDEMRINGVQINHFIREVFELLLRQLLSPLTIILGERFARLGLRSIDRELNSHIALFRNFTREFVEKRVAELQEHYRGQAVEPEAYTDLIEAFYYEDIVKGKQEVSANFVQEIINDFGQLYIAGTDTTSHSVQVALYDIVSHPQVLSKLTAEIDANIKDLRKLSYEDFKSCPYLEAVVLESLRMYSSANGIFPRVAIEDHHLRFGQESILITKGTIVNSQNFSIQYKSSVYADPGTFRPERFLDGEGRIIQPEPYTWMNFSAGFRSCVGRQLALTEIKTVLITLLSLYEFRCEDAEKLLYYREFSYNLANVRFWMRQRSRQ